MNSPPFRRVLRVGGVFLCVAATGTCALSDVFTDPKVEDVTLAYTGSLVLEVGDTVAAAATADIAGAAVADARFRFEIADTTVVGLTARGDSLVAKRRGRTAIAVRLESAVLAGRGPVVTDTLRVVVGSVVVAPDADTLVSLGDTATLAATAMDAQGNPIAGVPFTWESSDSNVVRVSPQGRLLARANGGVTVRALVDGDTGSAAVLVAQRLARIRIQPGALLLDALTAESTVVATGLDARDSAVLGTTVTWSSSDAAVATVTAAGRVRAIANGTARIRAQAGAVTDSVTVTVDQRATQLVISPDPVPPITALGDQVQLGASTTDRLGFTVATPGKAPGWATLDPTVTIVTTTGLVTGIGVGPGRIVAVLDAARDTAAVSVSNDPTSLEVQPAAVTLASIADTLPLSAIVRNSRGVIISGLTLGWQALDTTIVRVLADGRAIAVGAGTARVAASVGGVADTALITVTDAPLVVDIVPTGSVMASIGDSLTPAVDFRNARGAALGRSAVTWTSDDIAIARVTGNGIIIARDTGTTVIRATSPFDATRRDSIIITSTNAPASIVITGTLDTMTAPSQTLAYLDTVRNARGNVIQNQPIVWNSSNLSSADVSPQGVVTMTGSGSALIVARAGTVADTVQIVTLNPTLLYVDNAIVTPQRFGTLKRPYARIQDGVNAADANDTVLVRRGNASYSETVALSRRVTILGDSTAFVAGARDPNLLPLVSHDSGAAGITAFTTAQVTIKYLALRHTLDGLAVDAVGSDAGIEYLYVNPTATSRIGRGIRIRNAGGGASVRNSEVRQVRGFGIRFEDVFSGSIARVRVTTVDSLGGADLGVAIHVVRGANNRIDSSFTRGTEGTQIIVDSSLAARVRFNDLAGRHRLMRFLGYSRLSVIENNTFDMNFQAGQLGEDGLTSFNDGRSGLEIQRAGLVTASGNTFLENPTTNAGFGTMTGVHYIDQTRDIGSLSSVNSGLFKGGFRNIHSERSGWSSANTRFDSSGVAVWSDNDTEVFLLGDSLSNSLVECLRVSGTTTAVEIFQNTRFVNCHRSTQFGTGRPVWVSLTTGSFISRNTNYVGANQDPLFIVAQNITLRANVFNGAGTRTRTNTVNGALDLLATGTITMVSNTLSDYHHTAGATLSAPTIRFDSNSVSRNGVGTRITFFTTATSTENDIYDNDTSGVANTAAGALTLTNNWWGDDRGPRRTAVPLAAGDSAAGNITFAPVRVTPVASGTTATGIRKVRGDNQTTAANTALPRRFTVRVVDAQGRPVAGVTVTFAVTSGGGSLAVNINPTNASGLAEATLTLGASPGTNTVTATAAGQTVTFTATGT